MATRNAPQGDCRRGGRWQRWAARLGLIALTVGGLAASPAAPASEQCDQNRLPAWFCNLVKPKQEATAKLQNDAAVSAYSDDQQSRSSDDQSRTRHRRHHVRHEHKDRDTAADRRDHSAEHVVATKSPGTKPGRAVPSPLPPAELGPLSDPDQADQREALAPTPNARVMAPTTPQPVLPAQQQAELAGHPASYYVDDGFNTVAAGPDDPVELVAPLRHRATVLEQVNTVGISQEPAPVLASDDTNGRAALVRAALGVVVGATLLLVLHEFLQRSAIGRDLAIIRWHVRALWLRWRRRRPEQSRRAAPLALEWHRETSP